MARASKKTEDDDAPDDRPLYRVVEKAFIGHAILEAGSVTPYDHDAAGDGKGFIGPNLSPANDAAQAVIDAQSQPHPDKNEGPKAKTVRQRADAAAAAPAVAARPATLTGGPTGDAPAEFA